MSLPARVCSFASDAASFVTGICWWWTGVFCRRRQPIRHHWPLLVPGCIFSVFSELGGDRADRGSYCRAAATADLVCRISWSACDARPNSFHHLYYLL